MTVLFLGALCSGATTAQAQVPDHGQSSSGDVKPTLLGNPVSGSATAPAPAGSTVPGAVPRGATPATHVYVSASGGSPVAYPAAEFSLPADLAIDRMSLTLADDGAAGEDTSADAATLEACFLTGSVDAQSPDAPVGYDCTGSAKGVRKVSTSGGSWTFDASSLAFRVAKTGRFGLAILAKPAQTDAFSVSVLRTSVVLSYEGTPRANGVDAALAPPTAVAPTTEVAGLQAGPPPLSSDLVAAIGGVVAGPPMLAGQAPVGVTTVPQPATPALANAASSGSSDTRRWRPLLLLLVPVVPVLGLALNRRIGGGEQDTDSLADRYPGLASLRS